MWGGQVHDEALLNVKTGYFDISGINAQTISVDGDFRITSTGISTSDIYIGSIEGEKLIIKVTVDAETYTVEIPEYSYKINDVNANIVGAVKSYLITLQFMPKGINVTLECVVGTDTTWEDNFNLDETIQKTKYSHKKS